MSGDHFDKLPEPVKKLVLEKGSAGGGLPDALRAGVEQLSGLDMSSVRVHYNSHKPTQLNAHAFTQGQDIFLAPGQERHLPHEAWHVVQQQQGRVRPTAATPGSDTDTNLEKEADVMGVKALVVGSTK